MKVLEAFIYKVYTGFIAFKDGLSNFKKLAGEECGNNSHGVLKIMVPFGYPDYQRQYGI